MRVGRTLALFLVASCAAFAVGSAGCSGDQPLQLFSQSLWNPFGLEPLFAVDREPIRIGVVASRTSAWDVRAWWDITDRTPWADFRRELARIAKRPVQVEQLELFQLQAQLDSGRLAFAMLSPEQLAEVRRESDGCQVIAQTDGRPDIGLIVAKRNSDIKTIEDIAGHRFAFGPRGDCVFHYGVAAILSANGVTLDKIQREILPLNTLQYHISPREAAKEIAYGSTPVGVISKSAYDAYPETGGHVFPLSFGKDQFRVLGETEIVKYGPFVASRKTPPELVAKVRAFLVTAATDKPLVTRSLGVAGFTGVNGFTGVDAARQ